MRNFEKRIEVANALRNARKQTGLSQEKLAVRLGTTRLRVNAWENAKGVPSPRFRDALRELLPIDGLEFNLFDDEGLAEVRREYDDLHEKYVA